MFGRSPSYGYGTVFGSSDAGECDEFFKVTWPSDVDALKARLAPLFDSLDQSVQACMGLSPADRAAWAAFYATWKIFKAKTTPTFGSANEWTTACGYSKNLDAWAAKVKATNCTLVGPDPNAIPNAANKDAKGREDFFSAIRYGATALAIVAGVGVLFYFGPEIKALLPKGKG